MKLDKMDTTTNKMDKAYYFQHSKFLPFCHHSQLGLTIKNQLNTSFISFKSHYIGETNEYI